ncbi:MerR family transcriptional regulator [Metabacillus fastidiosus]|uniref:MerR family transcriptional regulator n=1 Tax=Metabacillus fastidiosus TaxID=1458 RepID=UPI003D2CC160
MEKLKDKRFVLFIGFAVVVIGITVFNILLGNRVQSGTDVEKLKSEYMKLLSENNEMKSKLSDVAPSGQENERQEYLSTVYQFIEVAMHIERDGFEKRKSQAKQIMSDEIFELFFPTDTYDYPDNLSSKPLDVMIYLQAHEPMQNEITLLAEYKNSLLKDREGEPEITNNVVKITLRNEDNKWKVTGIDEIKMSIEIT